MVEAKSSRDRQLSHGNENLTTATNYYNRANAFPKTADLRKSELTVSQGFDELPVP